MTGLLSAGVCRNMYANVNTADIIFLANGTWGLNTHIWWENIEGEPIPRPLPRQRHRP